MTSDKEIFDEALNEELLKSVFENIQNEIKRTEGLKEEITPD